MSKYKSESNSGRIGVLDVLQIVFIVLKLVGVIDWSWWVVLIPLWISLCLLEFFIIIMVINEMQ